MQEQAKKIKLWPIVVLILFILLLIGSTFAIFTLSLNSQKLNIIKAGDLSMTLDDTTSSGIKLVNAVPMSYQQGMETVEYTFTLKNDGSSNNDYSISLVDENTYINDNNEEVTITEENRLEDTKIRYILLKDGEEAEASKSKLLSDATDRVIDSGTINSKGEITYSLRIWIDSKAGSEVMNKIFKAKLRIDAIQAKKEVTPISFSEDDWSTISSAVKSGNLSAYNVGDTKIIDMGDYGMHTLRISNTSECTNGETSETACGFVVEFADIITTRAMNSSKSNVGGWPASQMRTFVNSTIYSALPSELQDVIANTIVISSHGSTSGESNFNSTDKLYLLSRKEIWNTTTGYSAGYDTSDSQTRQLEYYKNKGVTQSNYSGVIKQYKGSNAIWWLRSASSLTTDNFFSVSADGNRNYYASYTGNGVSPAFRIK